MMPAAERARIQTARKNLANAQAKYRRFRIRVSNSELMPWAEGIHISCSPSPYWRKAGKSKPGGACAEAGQDSLEILKAKHTELKRETIEEIDLEIKALEDAERSISTPDSLIKKGFIAASLMPFLGACANAAAAMANRMGESANETQKALTASLGIALFMVGISAGIALGSVCVWKVLRRGRAFEKAEMDHGEFADEMLSVFNERMETLRRSVEPPDECA